MQLKGSKLWFFPSGLFVVHRSFIRSRGVSFYENLRGEQAKHVIPRSAHYLERSWFYVFGMGEGTQNLAMGHPCWMSKRKLA